MLNRPSTLSPVPPAIAATAAAPAPVIRKRRRSGAAAASRGPCVPRAFGLRSPRYGLPARTPSDEAAGTSSDETAPGVEETVPGVSASGKTEAPAAEGSGAEEAEDIAAGG